MASARDLILRIIGRDNTNPATRSAGNNFTRLAKKLDDFNKKNEGFAKTADRVTLGAMAMGTGFASIGPAAGIAVAGVGALTTSLVSGGAALGVFGAVAKTAFTEVQEQSTQLEDLREKIDEARFAQEKAKKSGTKDERKAATEAVTQALGDYSDALAKLDPQQKKAIFAYQGMTGAWKGFVEQNKPATFGVMNKGFQAIGDAIPRLQPLFDVGAKAAGRFVDVFTGWVNGGSMDKLVTFLSTNGKTALADFGRIFANFGTTIANMSKEFDGTKITTWLAHMSDRMANWSAGGGFSEFMDTARETGPQVAQALGDVATGVGKIAEAVTPFAPVTLALATSLAAIIAAVPQPVLDALVTGFVAYSVAMRALAIAQGIATGVQWAYNAALTANPIGIVVVAIAALVAGMIVLWKRSQTAREVMSSAFAGMSVAVLTMAKIVLQAFAGIVDGVLGATEKVLRALGKIPGNDWADRAADEVKGFRDSAARSFDGAIAKTEEWRASVLNMPKKIKLQGNIEDLQGKIDAAKAKLKTVPDSKKAAIRGEISDLQAKLRTARADLANLQGKTVTVTTFYRTVGSQPGTYGQGLAVNKRAKGGPVKAGQPYLVGEEGPELVVPTGNGTVMTAAATARMMKGSAGSGRSIGKNLADTASRAVADAVRFASSSKQTKFGRWITESLAKGMTGSLDKVNAAADKLTSTLKKKLNAQHKALISVLKRNAAERARVEERLDAARAKLKDRIAARDQYAAGIRNNILDSGNVTKTNGDGENTAANIMARMRKDAAAAKAFGANLARLRKAGLNKTSYQQLLDGGIDGAGATAAALVKGGRSAISQVNRLTKELGVTGSATGKAAARHFYQAGIDSAAGLVKGLRSQEKALARVAQAMANALVRSLKRSLKIKSPSGVMASEVGQYLPLGIVKGIQGKQRHLDRAVAGMVNPSLVGGLSATTGRMRTGSVGDVHVHIHGHALASKDQIHSVVVDAINSTTRRGTGQKIARTALA